MTKSGENRISVLDLYSLVGRVAVVTGGAGPVGSVIAETLAELGAEVVVVDVDPEACSRVADHLSETYGGAHSCHAADFSQLDSLFGLTQFLSAECKQVDVLVNNAALTGGSSVDGYATSFDKQSAEAFVEATNVNLLAPFVLTQQLAPMLRKSTRGAVLNVSSIYGLVGPNMSLYEGTTMGNPAAYAATKGGLAQLTRYLATVLAPAIRINAIAPGGIERGQDQRFLERYERLTPLGRMATEDDLCGAVAWLASDASRYVTGQVIAIDGGWTAW